MESTGFRFCVWTEQKYEKRSEKKCRERNKSENDYPRNRFTRRRAPAALACHKGRTGGIGDGFQTVVCYLLIQSR